MLQHGHIAETKWEIRGRDDAWKRTLVVMTSLTLNPHNEDYSSEAEGELIDAITSYWKKNPGLIDAVNVRSTRVD